MTWFALGISIVMLVLLAGLMFATPALAHRTIPLGVSIPQERVGEPVVHAAVRNFRIATGGAFAVCVAFSIVFSAHTPALVLAITPILFVALSMTAYAVTRSTIIRAKRDQGWYDGVSVRLTADISRPTSARPPIGWTVVSVAFLLVVTAIGASLYAGLPERIAIHWNGAGEVDNYATKSVWTVFGPVLIGLGVVALLFGASLLARLSPIKSVASDTPEIATKREHVQRHLMMSLLGQLSVTIALMIGTLALLGWLVPGEGGAFIAVPIAFMVVLAGLLTIHVVSYSRAIKSNAPADSRRPDAPDDDRYWKAGFIYINRDDPAIFVPKRFGVGWTINAGSPGGFALSLVLVFVVVGGLLLAIIVPGSTHA